MTEYRAAILDLDGVITQTARLHARAWKQMFDEFLAGGSSFDIDEDYRNYVDGKPRYDGVRSFLRSRGLDLPEGTPDDAPEAETVCGLGNRKDALFHRLLRDEGVSVYEDAVAQLREWRSRGVKTAMITSSRNGREVLERAGLEDLFDARIDGVDADRLGIPGKPAPDVFLRAAAAVGVEPAAAIVVEDAISGVRAGRAGGFAAVVGVNRNGGSDLREHGADIVVSDMRRIDAELDRHAAGPAKPSALSELDGILERLRAARPMLFLDYDGTLTPIVLRPEDATLDESMQQHIRQLAQRVTVAIVSGRDLADVRSMVGVDDLIYAGSHGFDVDGPGIRLEHEEAATMLPQLDAAEAALRARLRDIPGTRVERKRFAIAVHFREAAESDEPRVEAIVDAVRAGQPELRKKAGKKIFELQPDVAWDKGRAVLWLLRQLRADGAVVPIYIGDDTTDEDAFRALGDRGLGIRVGEPDQPTAAAYTLRDTAELDRFFHELVLHLDGGAFGG